MTIVAYGYGISPGGGGGSDKVSLCVESELQLTQEASVNKVVNLAAVSTIDLEQVATPFVRTAAVTPVTKDSFNDTGVVNRNLNRRISQTLYSLKRLWGGSFSIYSVGDATVNHLTGTQDEPATVVHVRRGIILPGKHVRDIKHTVSMLSANKSFVFGGTYDKTARTFIVDRVDAPNLDLTESDYIIFDGKRYEVKEFQEFEFDSAWVIAGQAIEGETPNQIRLLSADNLIRLEHTATKEP